jgi:hypothetical protein
MAGFFKRCKGTVFRPAGSFVGTGKAISNLDMKMEGI